MEKLCSGELGENQRHALRTHAGQLSHCVGTPAALALADCTPRGASASANTLDLEQVGAPSNLDRLGCRLSTAPCSARLLLLVLALALLALGLGLLAREVRHLVRHGRLQLLELLRIRHRARRARDDRERQARRCPPDAAPVSCPPSSDREPRLARDGARARMPGGMVGAGGEAPNGFAERSFAAAGEDFENKAGRLGSSAFSHAWAIAELTLAAPPSTRPHAWAEPWLILLPSATDASAVALPSATDASAVLFRPVLAPRSASFPKRLPYVPAALVAFTEAAAVSLAARTPAAELSVYASAPQYQTLVPSRDTAGAAACTRASSCQPARTRVSAARAARLRPAPRQAPAGAGAGAGTGRTELRPRSSGVLNPSARDIATGARSSSAVTLSASGTYFRRGFGVRRGGQRAVGLAGRARTSTVPQASG